MPTERNPRVKQIAGVQLQSRDFGQSWQWTVGQMEYSWRENGELRKVMATGPEGPVVVAGLAIAPAVGWTLGYEAGLMLIQANALDVVREKPAKPAKPQ